MSSRSCYAWMAVLLALSALSFIRSAEDETALIDRQEKLWAAVLHGLPVHPDDFRDIDLDAALLQRPKTAEAVKARVLGFYSGTLSNRWWVVARRYFMRTQALHVLAEDASPRIRLMAYRLVLVADHAEALAIDHEIREDRPTLFFLRSDVEKALAAEKDPEVAKAVRQVGEWARSDDLVLRKKARDILFYILPGNLEAKQWLGRFPLAELPERLNREVAQDTIKHLMVEVEPVNEAFEASIGNLAGTPLGNLLVSGTRFQRTSIYRRVPDAHDEDKPSEEMCAFLQRVAGDEKAPLDHRWNAIRHLARLKQQTRLTALAENSSPPGSRAEAIVYMWASACALGDEKAYLRALELFEAQTDLIARALTSRCILSEPFKPIRNQPETEQGRQEADRWWECYKACAERVRIANKDDHIIGHIIDAVLADEESWRQQRLKESQTPAKR